MTSICFATNNPNKLAEIRQMVPATVEIKSLKDIGCEEELPETQETLEGNALQKANYVLEHYGVPCFADDTGLEVAALNGEPGVYSARYAGPQRSNADNISLLLSKLADKKDRSARFRTVIALVGLDKEYLFDGIVEGIIGEELKGEGGFGYDPVFYPEGCEITFAEMPAADKNAISHRGRAMAKLLDFLRKQA